MSVKKTLCSVFFLPFFMVIGCSNLPQATTKNIRNVQVTPISINVSNMYMNHLDIDPMTFQDSTKSIFESFLSGYEIKFVDDDVDRRESTLSTFPVEISTDDLVKFGFVDFDFDKGKIVAVSRSTLHPRTKKSVTGIGFFLEGWDGRKWVAVESNRMFEQRAYNIINDILANFDKKLEKAEAK